MPGVGRGNILGLLTYNKTVREKHLGSLAQWFHFVLVNFSEVRNKPLFEVTKLIFLELVDSLRERSMAEEYKEVSEIFKDALSFQDELVLFQALKKAVDYLSIEKEMTIIFLFDRFETYINMLTDDFFTNLRSLRTRAKYRFSAVFSLTRPLEELIEPVLMADYYDLLAGHTVFISLSDPEGLKFRHSYLEKASEKHIDTRLVEKILALTNGHGKLTKICLDICQQDHITQAKITRTLLLSIPSVQAGLLEIWSFLSTQEQDLLASAQGSVVQDTSNNKFLEDIGLIKKGRIAVPLFADFVQQRVQKEVDAPIRWDDSTNTIRKGSQTLSDNLTGAEFRLLRFLLANPDRVVGRDEIASTVWQGSTSTLGVSEQAIDQLVFRLRKKIEADPNKPTILLTIKGRGIKLQNN